LLLQVNQKRNKGLRDLAVTLLHHGRQTLRWRRKQRQQTQTTHLLVVLAFVVFSLAALRALR